MHAIYARVSTDDQARTGYSLTDQVNTCRQRLLAQGYTAISEYVDDGYSGEFLERPALSRLRADLGAKLIATVMVYDPDRLSRNLTNQLIIAADIVKSGAKLDFVTGSYDASPDGRLFFAMRGAIAEFEKEKIRERSLRGKRAKVMSGKPLLGKEPFGYSCDRANSRYLIIDEEADIVRTIFRLYIEETSSIAQLEAVLKTMGILTRSGKPFNRSVLHRMLSNELYAGIKWSFQTYRKSIGPRKRCTTARDRSEWVAIPVPAIIDQETFAKAAALRSRNKALAKRNTKAQYLLQGVIRCPACGYVMHGVRFPARSSVREYMYYVCTANTNGHQCENRRGSPAKELDEAVWEIILTLYQKSEGMSRGNKASAFQQERAAIQAKLKNLKTRQTAIMRWVGEGIIDLTLAEKNLQKLGSEITAIQLILAEPAKAEKRSDISPEEVFSARNFEQKRGILRRLGITIKACKDENGDTLYTITP